MGFRFCLGGWLLVGAWFVAGPARADAPKWLPRYDWDIRLDTDKRLATVKGIVTWTNRHQRPANEIVFNAHAHYSIPDKDIGLLAKMVELLRLAPSETMSFDGPALEVDYASPNPPKAPVVQPAGRIDRFQWDKFQVGIPPPPEFSFEEKNPTALVIPLAQAVKPGESVKVFVEFTVKIPHKKGRWGQWDGVTTLAQWLPTVAVYSEKGWDPAPFIPWHQPFHNEAGVYNVRVMLPSKQKLACSAVVEEAKDVGDGWQGITLKETVVRDFALISSDRFQEHLGKCGETTIRCLALPEHEYYAKELVKIAAEAMPVYNQWFGPYPYPQFTIVESYFGWNGNECGSLVMIDSRMFGMPHIARNYLDYLLSHELCHQWWYNVVGTNGYAETWMDEGLATYFSHRLIDRKLGNDNTLLEYPKGLGWLPNIKRDDFRNYGLIGVKARGEIHATVQDMPNFKHLVNLSAATYDRGSKIVGMLEERMGEAAFLDFMKIVYRKYQFQILRVADFQRELETYTRRDWAPFFQHWLYGAGETDWAVAKVEVHDPNGRGFKVFKKNQTRSGVRVVVHLQQKGQFSEPTVLGFRLGDQEGYQVRVPIQPEVATQQINELRATIVNVSHVETTTHGKAPSENRLTTTVEIYLPQAPTQVAVDPDRILLDANPTNNTWKPEVRWRFTPLMTQLDEVDVTNRYDRWNVVAGPWIWESGANDPWYTRSALVGLRAAVFRTQEFSGGAFLAYRTNDRNLVAGVDGLWDHVFHPDFQIGFNAERSLTTVGDGGQQSSRGVVYGRYVILHGSSLYQPPFEYVEAFAAGQQHPLPDPRNPPPGADPFNERYSLGVHYHKNLLTPYWDAEGGVSLDATYQAGFPIFGADRGFHAAQAQIATVKYFPKLESLGDAPVLNYLRQTRFAFRLWGAAATPNNGEFFALGGGDYFRGFDLQERQGNLAWVGSVEWRLPIIQNVTWDCCDHVAGIRNVYLAPFYDVGNAYLNNHQLGNTAHAVGLGLRVDVSWLGLIERTMIRFDCAQTLNVNTPLQFWFGIQHPF